MAFETADIFSSLNKILEAQERREQNEQQMAMQGMQFAQNKRQQDLENLYLSQDRFVQSAERAQGDMGVVLMEQGKNLLSWFEGPLFNEYYNQGDDGRFVFESSKTEKLVKDLAKAMGNEKKYKSIAFSMVSDMQKMYQNPNDYVHAKNLSTKLNTHIDKKSVRTGLAKMFVIPDDESALLLKKDMNQILSSNQIYNRILMEKTQTLKGDYAWDEPVNIPVGDQGKGDKERDKAQNTAAGSKLQQRKKADEVLTGDVMEMYKDNKNQLETAAALGKDAYFEKAAEIYNTNPNKKYDHIEWDPDTQTFIIENLTNEYGQYVDPRDSNNAKYSKLVDALNNLNDRSDFIDDAKNTLIQQQGNILLSGEQYEGSVYQADHLNKELFLNIESDILVQTKKQLGNPLYAIEKAREPDPATQGKYGYQIETLSQGSPESPTKGFNPGDTAQHGMWQGLASWWNRDYKWESDLPSKSEFNNMYFDSLMSEINKNK